MTLICGGFAFDPINASVLVDLLPELLHIRASDPAIRGIAPVVELIRREMSEKRAGQALVLTRLVEIILGEALRSAPPDVQSVGLLTGLRDVQLASALQGIHLKTSHPWTLEMLARAAGMSRSSRRRQEHADPLADDDRRDRVRRWLSICERVQHGFQPRNRAVAEGVRR